MAKIEESGEDDKRSGEMRVTIYSTDSGAGYEFVLKRKHIEVVRKQLPEKSLNLLRNGKPINLREADEKTLQEARKVGDLDWHQRLSDQEKTQVFALILSEYRKRSLGDNGFKGASIGAATDMLNGQTRLFIGTNTTRWASPYFKHCAEQNMVNGATDTLMYERSRDPKQDNKAPKAPKFKSVYVLQAISEDKAPISCPCGKCTDMLSNVMVENGEVVTLPFLSDAMKDKLKTDKTGTEAVALHTNAYSLLDIPLPGQTDKYEVWKTTIETLNRNRTIELSGKMASLQHDGLQILLAKAGSDEGLAELRTERDIQAIRAQMVKSFGGFMVPDSIIAFVPAFLRYVRESVRLLPQRMRELVDSVGGPVQKAAENALLQRKSIAALDCAALPGGMGVDLGKINSFMVSRILDTVGDRMHARGEVNVPAPGKRLKWLRENISSVRCVAIELDDGTYRYAVQATGKLDAAMPNAGVAALEQAVESLGRQGVRHVWGMEMNLEDIEHNRMRTSPKEEIERLMKRRSPEGIDFHYFPFNSGDLTLTSARKVVKHLSDVDIYPTSFRGSIATGVPGTKVKARPWTETIRAAGLTSEAQTVLAGR